MPATYKIVAAATGNLVTSVNEAIMPEFHALGKRGFLIPKEFTEGDANQEWVITKSPIHEGGFVIHESKEMGNVIRWTPNAPRHKICVWKAEPGQMKQVWKLTKANEIVPFGDESKNFHVSADKEFMVGEFKQRFYLALVPSSFE